MTIRSAPNSYNLRSLLEIIYRYRPLSGSNISHGIGSKSTVAKLQHANSMRQGLQLISANSENWKKLDTTNMVTDKTIKPPEPEPPRVNDFPQWAKWVLGSVLSLLLPFWKKKWEKLKMIEGEAEMVAEEIENAAEVVEKVAAVVENVADAVAEKLPENGKLKETALLVERVSKATAHDAQITREFIHKVDVLKQDFDCLKTMVEPAVEKCIQHKPEGK